MVKWGMCWLLFTQLFILLRIRIKKRKDSLEIKYLFISKYICSFLYDYPREKVSIEKISLVYKLLLNTYKFIYSNWDKQLLFLCGEPLL